MTGASARRRLAEIGNRLRQGRLVPQKRDEIGTRFDAIVTGRWIRHVSLLCLGRQGRKRSNEVNSHFLHPGAARGRFAGSCRYRPISTSRRRLMMLTPLLKRPRDDPTQQIRNRSPLLSRPAAQLVASLRLKYECELFRLLHRGFSNLPNADTFGDRARRTDFF